MSKEFIDSDQVHLIEVNNCKGDLVIRTWNHSMISASGEYEFEKSDEAVIFTSTGDLQIEVPESLNIKIGSVHGDLVIKNIIGSLGISEVFGDAVLTNIGQVKLNKIHGDLVAKNLEGPFSIEEVDGDMVLRNINNDVTINEGKGDLNIGFINGDLLIKQISGDVSIRTISGDISIETVHRDANLQNLGGVSHLQSVLGDIRISGGLTSGKHQFNANGDIVLRWPVNSPLVLTAEAPVLQNRLPLLDIEKFESGISGRIGEGETFVHLTAKGKILLKEEQIIDEKWNAGGDGGMDFMFDWVGIGERVSAEVNQQISKVAEHLESQFGPDFAQNISDKVSRQAERAARQAEKAAERARKYAEREVSRAQRWDNQYASAYDRGKKNPETAKPQSKASSEEQMKILKMVEKGTISPGEAATLLEALEG